MKKTIIAMLSIVLMLFAFAACSNDSGNPGFAGDVDDVATALDPASLVSDVLKPNASGVDVEYRLIANNAKALSDGAYTLRATVTFTEYKVGSYTITDGVLVYEFVGNVSNNRFTVTAGSSCTVTTDSANPLVVSTAEGNVDVTINDSEASVSISSAINVSAVGDDGIVSNSAVGTVTVTIATENTVTVDGEDVKIPEPDTPDDNDPVTPPRQYITNANIAEVAASGSGTYYLSEDITLTDQLNITAPITIDGDEYTISKNTAGVSDAAVETDSIIQISVDGVTLRNLTVEGSSALTDEWDSGEYGIKIYDAEGVTLQNVTVTAVNAGIQVNGSKVTLTGTTTVTGNVFGGIEVCKGDAEGLSASTLTINGTVVSTDETVPAVWIDIISDNNVVTDNSSDKLTSFDLADKNQTWFITSSQVEKDVDKRDIQIGNQYYTTLAKAVESAQDGDTINILSSIEGSGVVFAQDKFTANGITINLNGNTYTVVNPTVGSSGTETNGFQLLRGNKVTFENGQVTAATSSAKILFQNYCDLILDNIIATAASSTQYVASNNFGSLTLRNGSTLNANDGCYAFDIYYWPSNTYVDGVDVIIEDSSVVINGKVQYAHDSSEDGIANFREKTSLIVPAGYESTLDLEVTDYTDFYDYKWVSMGDGTMKLEIGNITNITLIRNSQI